MYIEQSGQGRLFAEDEAAADGRAILFSRRDAEFSVTSIRTQVKNLADAADPWEYSTSESVASRC